jgi:hypothetical protein
LAESVGRGSLNSLYVGSARLVAAAVGDTDRETERRESSDLANGESEGDAK